MFSDSSQRDLQPRKNDTWTIADIYYDKFVLPLLQGNYQLALYCPAALP
jgi:hypothetical protein